MVHYQAQGVHIFLRTSLFRDRGAKVKFSRSTAFPHEILRIVEPLFEEMFEQGVAYRATGVTLLKLIALTNAQMELFEPWQRRADGARTFV